MSADAVGPVPYNKRISSRGQPCGRIVAPQIHPMRLAWADSAFVRQAPLSISTELTAFTHNGVKFPRTVSREFGAVHFGGMATYTANLCPLFGRAEFADFREDFGQPIGEPVEATSRRAVRQGSPEHLDCVLSEEQ